VSDRPRRRWFRAGTFAVLFVAGTLLAASAVTSQGTDLRAEGTSDLKELVARQAQRGEVLAAQVADLQAEVQTLSDAQGGGPELARQRVRLAALAPAAGFTPVVGPAVSVVLDDAPKPPPGQNRPGNPTPDDLVVHQQDVQAVVNALWRGGASAMQIMDQRVISTSAVRCVGNTLLLQGRVYSPPFRVTAIGDPRTLRAALDADPILSVYRQAVTLYGLGYDVSEDSGTTIPAYHGPLTLTYAVPVP
jgi:uncharacterized protein YlxW (UPF0749 family)